MSTTTAQQPPILPTEGAAKKIDLPDPRDDSMWEDPPSCAQRMLAVMEDVGNVPKDDYNEAQKFYYRSVEKVVAATRDAMIKHGLLCVPTQVSVAAETTEVTTSGGKASRVRTASLKIVYTFMSADDHEDAIETQIVSEAQDYGDKAVSQALTAAHKAILLQTFQIGDSGTDQDAGADQTEYADEMAVENIRDLIGELDGRDTRVLRRAWRPSWGSAARGVIPLSAVEEITGLLNELRVDVEASGS